MHIFGKHIFYIENVKKLFIDVKNFIFLFFFQLILVKEIIVKEVTTCAEITEVRVA